MLLVLYAASLAWTVQSVRFLAWGSCPRMGPTCVGPTLRRGSKSQWYVRASVQNRAKLTASRHQHRTASVDYNIICAYLVGDLVSLATQSSSTVSGELVLITEDNDERTVRPGDIVLQRGTLHGWRNASPTTWVRMLSVLVDADPAVVNGVALRDDWRGENAMGG